MTAENGMRCQGVSRVHLRLVVVVYSRFEEPFASRSWASISQQLERLNETLLLHN